MAGWDLASGWSDSGSGQVVEVHAQDREPPVLVLARELAEHRERGHAGGAPGGPEVDQHDLASQAGQADRLAIHVFALDLRGGLADQVSRASRRSK